MKGSGDRAAAGLPPYGVPAGSASDARSVAGAPAVPPGLRETPVSGKASRMNHTDPDGCGNAVETPLKRCVSEELARYFEALDGEQPCDLHKMVIGETEQALLQFVLERTSGNQSRAAQLLGLNRGTLRKKLQYYALI